MNSLFFDNQEQVLNINNRTITIKTKLDDILSFTEKDKLDIFIKQYTQKDITFNNALFDTFSPKRRLQNKLEQPGEDYVKFIKKCIYRTFEQG